MNTCAVTTEITQWKLASTQKPPLIHFQSQPRLSPKGSCSSGLCDHVLAFLYSSATFVCGGVHPQTIEFSFACFLNFV